MADSTAQYASIALPLPINTPFTYSIPQELAATAVFGHRALVPFGKQLLTGFIIAVGNDPGDVPLSKIKPIVDIIDDEPVFDGHMLKLAEWVAEYYISSVGEVLKAATPFGTQIRSRMRVVSVSGAKTVESSLTGRQKDVLELIGGQSSILMRELQRKAGFPVSAAVKSLEKKGFVRLEREITTPSAKPQTVRFVHPAESWTPPASSRAREQIRCREVLEKYHDGISLEELLERYSFSRGVVNALVKSGSAYYEERDVPRSVKILDQTPFHADQPLTEEQAACFSVIMAESMAPVPRPVLIRGVTGSGKTRIYIEIVKEMLAKKKSALILVPEISLTPQTTRFFTSVFPGQVAVMHSAMSPGERYDMWRLIHSGARDVIIGPRSAVFAPLIDPGVIIIDEEHDTSYKQTDTSPRYHARDTAVVRGHLLKIPVVMGSATPSLESWQNSLNDKYILTTLEKRVHARPLPEIVSVDMREEREAGNYSSISRRLREELGLRIEKGEKSIILINRRGFSSIVQCLSCGQALMCPQCDITLTYHSSKGLAVCHLCGHGQIVLEHCPNCGSTDIHFSGRGTQKIEKELETITNPDSIIRMDSDTTTAHDAHYRLLEEFRNSSASILLGTQMVAKGLDFPEVTLVGIISADSSLFIPDFRAGERTFQLITQVAGRAGRGQTAGMVVLQTHNTDNYAVTAAVTHDFIAFAEQELEERQELGFPPYTRLALFETASIDRLNAESTAVEIAGYLAKYGDQEAEILGPVEAPIPRIRGKYRIHILLKHPKITRILPLLRFTADKFARHGVTLTIDVDPVDMM